MAEPRADFDRSPQVKVKSQSSRENLYVNGISCPE